MRANFILISLCFFSLAFTKAVGSKRGTRPPVGEGEGRAGRPRPRPPRPLSREDERAAPRPRDVERSRDDEARSSRAAGGPTGGVRLPLRYSASSLLSVFSRVRRLRSDAFASSSSLARRRHSWPRRPAPRGPRPAPHL